MTARAVDSAIARPSVVSLEPEGCLAIDSGVVLGIHRAPIQGARVAEVRRAIEAAAQSAPKGLLSIGVFRLSPEFPLGVTATTNVQELAELLRTVDRLCVAHATIIEFGGLRAAAMRTMARAIYALARPRSAYSDFDGLTDAVTWLRPYAERVGAKTDYATYLRLYREVERELDELDVRRGATGSRSVRA